MLIPSDEHTHEHEERECKSSRRKMSIPTVLNIVDVVLNHVLLQAYRNAHTTNAMATP